MGDAFEPELHRLGRAKQVFPERFLLPPEIYQRQSRGYGDRALRACSAALQLLGDGRQGQQVVAVVFRRLRAVAKRALKVSTLLNTRGTRRWRNLFCKISPQDRLAACPADKKLPVRFQGVLQGVRFVAVGCNPCGKRKIFGFDGVVAMIDTEVHVFNIPFVKMWNTLPAGKRNVPFPAGKFWGYRGESVREGEKGVPVPSRHRSRLLLSQKPGP